MKTVKIRALLCLVLALALILGGCSIPMPGFADYDVSRYIQALLDSSYLDSHGELLAVAKITEEKARENNTSTVENAAVTFCNTYGLAPTEAQLEELKVVMKRAFELARYTVKEERKTETGYYLEVEIAPIVNFMNRSEDLEKLRLLAQQEADAINNPPVSSAPEGEESSAAPIFVAGGVQRVDANALYIDKVLDFCKQELANISYDSETRSIPLDIRQTEEGELQLDLRQIEAIDRMVVRFS